MSTQDRRAAALKRLSARYGDRGTETDLAGAALADVAAKVRERGEVSEGEAFAVAAAETKAIRDERRHGAYARTW
ncbi:Uncharacterised protein (plasmid) [Tsukamurella tyrosinosolvens]|uniref:Uncharacterized protein n=1 Tax=Tsukamurella tyrosinosolvens TaxID=57704 RepID=A0A1H5AZT5_TSUTY|nr:hypothetical protein [Tsukamurella tyrosinosolvens]KXO95206.1 hypothetical protein AXK58_10750 [Tsukamurella tyrosinosolvens]SED47705.1 hypothetical protein SAMN04489793_5051 [Tsukamurella tyrosinosolvens]VEH88860.1 Uncharacterised protein [Tsukamurella tyrosinosolvens]